MKKTHNPDNSEREAFLRFCEYVKGMEGDKGRFLDAAKLQRVEKAADPYRRPADRAGRPARRASAWQRCNHLLDADRENRLYPACAGLDAVCRLFYRGACDWRNLKGH